MDPKTRIQGLRNSALEMADQHGRYLESWELARAQAAALGEALYSASGLEPPVPLEQWDWTSASILSRLRQACDNILRRMLQPQQGGDAEAREAIDAVRNILISASDFKPGMSRMERLTELVQGFAPRDTSKDVRRDYKCVDATAGASVWEPVESADHIEVKFKMQSYVTGSVLIRMTIDGNQRATARASKIFNRISYEDFHVSLEDVSNELKSALLDRAKGEDKRTTVLEWKKGTHLDGHYIGRILSRESEHMEGYIVHYNMESGGTGPSDVPEHVRESFRRAIHEVLLSDISKLPPNELSPEDIEKRLVAMREHYGFSDEEVVASATDGTIPSDPDYCEWLVLLGRGDLIRS